MNRATMSRELAVAIAWDAGNESMEEGRRAAWSAEDYNRAVDMFNELWPEKGLSHE